LICRLKVKVFPGASENRLASYRDGVLVIKVKDPPEKGRANAGLIKLLSESLAIHQSDIEIVLGFSSRTKTLQINGYDSDEINLRLYRALSK